MATGQKRPMFEDFYGKVDTGDIIDKRPEEVQDCDHQVKTQKSGKTSAPTKTSKKSSGEPRIGSARKSDSSQIFTKSANVKRDGAFGSDDPSESARAPHKDGSDGDDRDGAAKVAGKITTHQVGNGILTNIEWTGGSGPRVYRRPRHLAKGMANESCPDGPKVKRGELDVMSEVCIICNLCKKTSPEPLKRCARCCAVSYCSKECQLADFKAHKIFCWRCDRFDIARARVYPALRFFPDLKHAKDYSVLLRDMPTEQQYERGAWCNLLVEIQDLVYHPWGRYTCLVGDLSGDVTRVVFHDQSNEYRHPNLDKGRSSTSPLNSCFLPGRFLLIMGVYWRQFQDGRPGIRINDLDSIYVINMADHEWPKHYRRSIEQAAKSNDLTKPLNMDELLRRQMMNMFSFRN
ncbi:hypothetical protein EGW08_023586 [Elysia chlorotica]|uniref:MYND-type domain-containing protein n=1 Tax=Elysia chlorotica TaxID=188477 RepID=A0A433SIC1_ELYCH|nr:hypothetical protein EGW08_023586 [Elysia chlorotica]